MLDTKKVIDSVQTRPNGIILYREKIFSTDENGNEVFDYFRTSLSPGDDVSKAPDEIKSLAQSLWTEDVVHAFKEKCQSSVFWISKGNPPSLANEPQGA